MGVAFSVRVKYLHNFLRLYILNAETSEVQSLQYLSRYLNMDMTRVFSETEAISTQLLAEVKSSRLKVELCQECSYLNKIFSQKYRKLEKIEMEVKSCVNLIHRKLSVLKKSDSVQGDLHGKSKILKVLRTEAEEKCVSKVEADCPRPKVQKLSLEQVRTKQLKIKTGQIRRMESVSVEEPSSDVKMETSHSNFDLISSHDDNDPNYSYFDDDNEGSNAQEEEQAIMNYDNAGNDHDGETVGTIINRNDSTIVTQPTKSKVSIDPSQYTVIVKTGKYKCKVCEKELTNLGCFQKHYKSVHLKIRYKCFMCGKEFPTNSNYHRHVKKEHLGITFKCQGCGKSYAEKYALKTHHQRSNNCGMMKMAATQVKNEPNWLKKH